MIATRRDDGQIYVVDPSSGRKRWEALSPFLPKKAPATARAPNTIGFVEININDIVGGGAGTIKDVMFNPGQTHLAVLYGHGVALHEVASGRLVETLADRKLEKIWSVSADGKAVALARGALPGVGGDVHIWRPGQSPSITQAQGDFEHWLTTPDTARLFHVEGNQLMVFAPGQNRAVAAVDLPGKGGVLVDFSPDARRFAYATRDGFINVLGVKLPD